MRQAVAADAIMRQHLRQKIEPQTAISRAQRKIPILGVLHNLFVKIADPFEHGPAKHHSDTTDDIVPQDVEENRIAGIVRTLRAIKAAWLAVVEAPVIAITDIAVRMRHEIRNLSLNLGRQKKVVGIEERYKLPFRFLDRRVAGRRQSPVLLKIIRYLPARDIGLEQ